MMYRGHLYAMLVLCLLLSPALMFGQAVAVNAVVASSPITSCTNTSVTLSGLLSAANYAYNGASVSTSGSTITVTVDYLSGFIILPAITPFTQTINLGNLAPGTYTVVGAGSLNGGFQSSMSISITVVSCCPAIPSFTANSTSICPGDSVHLTNTSTGATSNAWYQNGTFLSSNTNVSVPLSTPGTYVYKLVVTDGVCSDSTSQTVTVNLLPAIDLGNDTSLCQGSSLTLNPGPLFPTYSWSTGASSQTILVNSVGTYTVTVTDINGCHIADTLSITSIVPNAQVSLGNDTTICPGDSIALDPGSGWSSYSWSDGSNGSTLSATTPGTYTVTVTATGQCSGTSSINLSNHVLPVLSLGNDTSVCSTLTLDAGNQFSQYAWSGGQSTSNVSVSTSGTYTVTVTDANSCKQEDDATVTITGGPMVFIGNDTSICIHFNDSARLDATTVGASAYLWSDGSTNPTFVGGANFSGIVTYWVVVTDVNGCTATDSINVNFKICLGVGELTEESEFSLFPNPGTDVVHLKTDLQGAILLQLMDAQGRIVLQESRVFSGQNETLDLSSLAAGVYHLRLQQDGKSITRKLLVE